LQEVARRLLASDGLGDLGVQAIEEYGAQGRN
jgi:hypothetical protein